MSESSDNDEGGGELEGGEDAPLHQQQLPRCRASAPPPPPQLHPHPPSHHSEPSKALTSKARDFLKPGGVAASVSVLIHSKSSQLADALSRPLTPKPTRVTKHQV